MADDVRIIIYDSVIDSWSLPGGMVWRWARQRAVRIERLAKLNVKSRTGELARSISVSYETAPPKQVTMNVVAGAAHGLWVHEGTRSPIVSLSGGYMVLPPWGPYPMLKKTSVSGQRANPFLADALHEVMRSL